VKIGDLIDKPWVWWIATMLFLGPILYLALHAVYECEKAGGVAVHGACIKKDSIVK
jgi:hypothetical protein